MNYMKKTLMTAALLVGIHAGVSATPADNLASSRSKFFDKALSENKIVNPDSTKKGTTGTTLQPIDSTLSLIYQKPNGEWGRLHLERQIAAKIFGGDTKKCFLDYDGYTSNNFYNANVTVSDSVDLGIFRDKSGKSVPTYLSIIMGTEMVNDTILDANGKQKVEQRKYGGYILLATAVADKDADSSKYAIIPDNTIKRKDDPKPGQNPYLVIVDQSRGIYGADENSAAKLNILSFSDVKYFFELTNQCNNVSKLDSIRLENNRVYLQSKNGKIVGIEGEITTALPRSVDAFKVDSNAYYPTISRTDTKFDYGLAYGTPFLALSHDIGFDVDIKTTFNKSAKVLTNERRYTMTGMDSIPGIKGSVEKTMGRVIVGINGARFYAFDEKSPNMDGLRKAGWKLEGTTTTLLDMNKSTVQQKQSASDAKKFEPLAQVDNDRKIVDLVYKETESKKDMTKLRMTLDGPNYKSPMAIDNSRPYTELESLNVTSNGTKAGAETKDSDGGKVASTTMGAVKWKYVLDKDEKSTDNDLKNFYGDKTQTGSKKK